MESYERVNGSNDGPRVRRWWENPGEYKEVKYIHIYIKLFLKKKIKGKCYAKAEYIGAQPDNSARAQSPYNPTHMIQENPQNKPSVQSLHVLS